MDESYQFVYRETPEWGVIGGGINAFNTQQAGDDNGKTLCFVILAPGGEIVGGTIGATYWDWLYIELMWIRDDLRRMGFGRQLMHLAEEEAKKRGARISYLDTFSFQAPDFYKKLGYQVFGELLEFPPGHQRYFLTRKL